MLLSSRTGKAGVVGIRGIRTACLVCSLNTSANRMQKTLTLDTINPNVKKMQYAVRGPLVIRANEIEKELENGAKKPFEDVIKANIGDCQAMGQKPLTFIRQIVALCTYPQLLNSNEFPSDVKERVKTILSGCGGGSVGSYSDSAGVEIIKKHVAQYIEKRDGIPSDYKNIILSTGASEGIKSVLSILNFSGSGKLPGVMTPIPQYPLYSATLAEFNMEQIGYYLDEDNEWALDIAELKRSITKARKISEPKAIVVINPGNPTGSVLTRENIENIIKFAYEQKLFILADEVYQDNIYKDNMEFHSFKKVIMQMGSPYKDMELASFMSASKGYMGECGLRGGYCEIVNADPDVKAMLLKLISARLCSSILGQATMDCVVNPPVDGEPSYPLFIKEKQAVLISLKERAKLVAQTLNSINGIKCNEVAGAMYAFPKLTLPKKAIEKAKSVGQEPDFFFAMQLLENTGICIVPGSGFGQVPGTYHFRTTILPQPDRLKVMMQRFKAYHEKFMKEYK